MENLHTHDINIYKQVFGDDCKIICNYVLIYYKNNVIAVYLHDMNNCIELEIIRDNLFNMFDKMFYFISKYNFYSNKLNKIYTNDFYRISFKISIYKSHIDIQFDCVFINYPYYNMTYKLNDVNEMEIVEIINDSIKTYNQKYNCDMELLKYKINVKSAKY